jgi:hypothetical protein
MASANQRRTISCQCEICSQHPYSEVAKHHRRVNRMVASFDERHRRLFVGFLADQLGEGGISQMATITGMSRNTIRRGKKELSHPLIDSSRIRAKGGGRKPIEQKT